MYQLIFEQRIKLTDIEEAVGEKSKSDDSHKIYSYFANELIKYLAAKLTKAKMAGFRGTPQKANAQDKELSKSEQFLERKRKEALEKASKENEDKSGQAEKIGLKDIGKDIEEREETMKELEKKREEQQKSTETEYEKHTFAYQIAFELYAQAVKSAAGKEADVEKLCEIIKEIGSPDLNKRQVALGKIGAQRQCVLAIDALVASMKDKNIIIPIINVLTKTGSKKCIMPLISLIMEYPTPKDILFRGPAEKAIGETIRLQNEKEKSAGTKYMFQMCSNPKFEPTIKVLAKILIKDIIDEKIRSDYFTPLCLKWMSLIAEKVAEKKKKTVKVGFVNVTKQTDLSKQLGEFASTARQHIS